MRLPEARVTKIGYGRGWLSLRSTAQRPFPWRVENPRKRRPATRDICQLVEFGIALAIQASMPEVLTCSCCASPRIVVRSFECEDCGVVTVLEPHRDREGPVLREKRDRRREPWS
jgi:hypothetical protein